MGASDLGKERVENDKNHDILYLGREGGMRLWFSVRVHIIGRWSDPLCRSSLIPQYEMLFSELLEAHVRSRVELCDPLNHVVSPGLLSSVKSLVLIQFIRFSLPVFCSLLSRDQSGWWRLVGRSMVESSGAMLLSDGLYRLMMSEYSSSVITCSIMMEGCVIRSALWVTFHPLWSFFT